MKDFDKTICELYALPYGAPVGAYLEFQKTRNGMVHSSVWRTRIVFAVGSKLVSLRLNEEHFSNYPLQWVRHLGHNRKIGNPAVMQHFPTRHEAELYALQGAQADDFSRAYMRAALWTSVDDDGTPFDDLVDADDISPATRAAMLSECIDFQTENKALLKTAYLKYARIFGTEFTPQAMAGHDFWLTRNGHGAGFWDRGLKELGDKLASAAKAYAGVDLYIGDDKKVYG